MNIAVRWLASQSAACFYVANALRRGRSLVDTELAAAIAEPAERLHQAVATAGIDVEAFWEHLVPLAARVGNNRQLAEMAVRKILGMGSRLELLVPRLAGPIGEVEATVERELPELTKELSARAQPLGESWASLGSAIIEGIARRTDPGLIVSDAEVIAVPATIEGGGTAHLLYNSLSIEILEGESELPEVLRLGWLLSQLNVDVPIFSEHIAGSLHGVIASLSMLPPLLCAGEDLELTHYDVGSVREAIRAWHIETPLGVDAAETVVQWWQTCTNSRPPWNVALGALDQMLHPNGS